MDDDRMTRREFLATTAAASAAIIAGRAGLAAPSAGGDGALVVRCRRAQLFTSGEADQDAVAPMVHAAVRKLAGVEQGNLGQAWGVFLKPEDVVGIKVNCLFGYGASTHLEVVNAIIAGCRAAGVPPEHIIVWDRDSGDLAKTDYPVNRDKPGVRFYGTDGAYEEEPTQQGAFRGRVTKILTREVTALINAPFLKTHSAAGITMSLKNHYGTIHNPAEYHGGFCDPGIADVNSIPAVRGKTRLIIADALFPIAEGGPQARPGYTWPYGAILVSTDPVAIDAVGLQILNERRKQVGLAPLGRQARHIATAAARGLGVADRAHIRVVEVA